MMVTRFAIIFAQSIFDGVVGGGDVMHYPAFNERLQGAVNRHAVERTTGHLLNVSMGECAAAL